MVRNAPAAPSPEANRHRHADGVLLYAKPPDVTSHDVVAHVRHSLRERLGADRLKIGHAGTLDPFATGLLLVLVGRATRAQRFLMKLPKTYRAVARLGWTSDTGDRDGELRRTGRVPDEVRLPVGEIYQRPPAYSAVRVGGRRLYERARAGEPVEGAPRPVTVHRAQVLWRDGDRVALELECSSGTYVRQLVAGIGDAYCEELERTAIGHFRLEDADPERILPLDEALRFLPDRRLDADEAERVAHGRSVPVGPPGTGTAGAIRLTHGGRLLAIAEPRQGVLRPVMVLAP
ncbi:MAG TPA: tRNA pseudouridine(55) synthase TruB [Thermoleophilaceae bacterium]|nr:tRNA pseudouridine(55) synthase TruB [Thermoleophilaceae bacterium]